MHGQLYLPKSLLRVSLLFSCYTVSNLPYLGSVSKKNPGILNPSLYPLTWDTLKGYCNKMNSTASTKHDRKTTVCDRYYFYSLFNTSKNYQNSERIICVQYKISSGTWIFTEVTWNILAEPSSRKKSIQYFKGVGRGRKYYQTEYHQTFQYLRT